MALINCYECNKEISDKAENCPHCGSPSKEKASQTDFSKEENNALSVLKCIVSYNKYGGFCVPESSCHRPVSQRIFSNGVWEPDTIEFIMSNCGDGDVVHAGTYFGDFLSALSKGITPSRKNCR